MNKIKYIFLSFLIFTSYLVASGNKDKLELGTAVYCDLRLQDIIDWAGDNHWHTGIFQYFEYLPDGKGRIRYTIMKPYEPFSCENCSQNHNLEYTINTNYPSGGLNTLREYFKASFNLYGYDLSHYHGAYSRNNISANKRSSIASTANALGSASIDYTWLDMLDPVNDYWFWNDWDGTIGDIDELRCDGIVEYSYEKNGIIVSNGVDISIPDYGILDFFHNDLHTHGYNWPELCPKIQSGDQEDVSTFEPLIALDPEINNFTTTQYSNKIQLNFKVEDNASVKAYVLIQVKKINESTWRTLIDNNNNSWKFKEVDLTDWNGNYQYDYFHIPWAGKYDGGYYNSNDHSFEIKITVIDQGINYSSFTEDFIGNILPVEVSISGPSYLDYKEQGTYTANVSNGSGSVTYEWYKSFNGGSSWGSVIATSQTITTTMLNDDFLLRSDVHDTQTGEDDSDTQSVSSEFLPKQTIPEKEIEVLPTSTRLNNNYPNPFNPITTIKYQLKENGFVSLKVFDVLGKEVANLVNENKSGGFYETIFDASNLTSGFYIYKLTVNDFVSTKKMLLTK